MEVYLERLNRVLSEPDSMSTRPISKKWFQKTHRDSLLSFSPFDDILLDSLFRNLILRLDSRSSLRGVLRNTARVLWSNQDFPKARDMKNHPIMNAVCCFVMDVSRVEKKALRDVLTHLEFIRKKDSFDNKSQRRVTHCLSLEETSLRMQSVINDSNSSRSNGKTIPWFTPRHLALLNELTVFESEPLDTLLRRLLQCKSSRESLAGVAANVISVLWRREDARHLSPASCLSNSRFQAVWSFVVSQNNFSHKQFRAGIHNALRVLRMRGS